MLLRRSWTSLPQSPDARDPHYSLRTFDYQAPQYFLAGATGPWGALAWSYDKIGNRLSETRNGATDTYNYPTNLGGGTSSALPSGSIAKALVP